MDVHVVILCFVLLPLLALWGVVLVLVAAVRAREVWRNARRWQQGRENLRRGFDPLPPNQKKSPPDQGGDT